MAGTRAKKTPATRAPEAILIQPSPSAFGDVAPTPLDPSQLHIYNLALDLPSGFIARLRAELSADERDRSERFATERLRTRFIAAHAGLRRILGTYLSVPPREVRMQTRSGGKPELIGKTDLRFSLSHTTDLGLVALTRGSEVGVDGETLRKIEASTIAARFFTEDEAKALTALDETNRHRSFFRVWTIKEAFLKCEGHGIAGWLSRFDVSALPGEPPRLLEVDGSAQAAAAYDVIELELAKGYVGTAVVRGYIAQTTHFRWP